MVPIGFWVAFNAFVLTMLALDLGVFHRRAHAVSAREAGAWTVVWVSLAMVFCVGIDHYLGRQKALEFLTGYLVEEALSADNIFVFVLLFSYFRVPREYQHRVLFWGILGALVMRGAFIGLGTALVTRFHWVLYLFGAFLVFTGIRMATQDEKGIEPEANPVLRLLRRLVPVTERYHEQRFFVRVPLQKGWVATPLFVVLVLVETTDLLFAVDSIPAVFAVTLDPFIVYTSNVFAILGLRSLYFLLASVIHRFHFLQIGLSLILSFIGAKMLLMDLYPISIGLSLGLIVTTLAVAVGASLLFPKQAAAHDPVDHDPLAPSDGSVEAPIDDANRDE